MLCENITSQMVIFYRVNIKIPNERTSVLLCFGWLLDGPTNGKDELLIWFCNECRESAVYAGALGPNVKQSALFACHVLSEKFLSKNAPISRNDVFGISNLGSCVKIHQEPKDKNQFTWLVVSRTVSNRLSFYFTSISIQDQSWNVQIRSRILNACRIWREINCICFSVLHFVFYLINSKHLRWV